MSDHYYVRNRFLEACRWNGTAQISVDLNSGHEEHRPRLTVIIGRLYVTIRLPKWVVQPHRRKVSAAGSWDAATIARLGRDWYWDETRREFGFSLAVDRVNVKYGVQTDSWPGDKSWSYYFPWMKWRAIEDRWLGLDGTVSEVVPNTTDYEARAAAKARAPAVRFAFTDFDGERIEATIRMEEFVHVRGGWAWLERLLPPKVGRRYDIELDKEAGPKKGSWKGACGAATARRLPTSCTRPRSCAGQQTSIGSRQSPSPRWRAGHRQSRHGASARSQHRRRHHRRRWRGGHEGRR